MKGNTKSRKPVARKAAPKAVPKSSPVSVSEQTRTVSDVNPTSGQTYRSFGLDYAPMQMSLPVDRGFVRGLVRNSNGENFLTVAAEGLANGDASISIPLDHAREFLARLTRVVDDAERNGLSVA